MPALPPTLRATLLTLTVSACATPPPPVTPDPPPVEEPQLQAERWDLVPNSIQHQGNTLFVQAALAYTPATRDLEPVAREREVFVGVTAVTSDGTELDLAVTTFFPGHFEAPFTLSAEVGADVQDVLFGVWDRKIEPCDSTRSGCREFGFLLDGSLATWPPTVYVDGTRQRIPNGDLDLLVLDGGVGGEFADRVKASTAALSEQLQVFGMAPTATSIRAAEAPTSATSVLVRNSHDVLVGRQLASSLGADASAVTHNAEAPAAFVITLGGESPERTTACSEHQDDAYMDCVNDG